MSFYNFGLEWNVVDLSYGLNLIGLFKTIES